MDKLELTGIRPFSFSFEYIDRFIAEEQKPLGVGVFPSISIDEDFEILVTLYITMFDRPNDNEIGKKLVKSIIGITFIHQDVKETDLEKIDFNILDRIMNVAVATTRGFVSSQLSATPYYYALLPIQDSENLVKKAIEFSKKLD